MTGCVPCALAEAQRKAVEGEINGDAFDRFTVAHAAWGVGMGAFKMPWWGALIVAVGWELIENPLKDRFPKAFPNATHDTMVNAVVDAAAMMAGWGAARWVRSKVG